MGRVGGDFVRQPENKRLTLLSGVLSTLAAKHPSELEVNGLLPT